MGTSRKSLVAALFAVAACNSKLDADQAASERTRAFGTEATDETSTTNGTSKTLNDKDLSPSPTPTPTPSTSPTPSDVTPPTAGSAPNVTAKTSRTLTVTWPAATDNTTPSSELAYLAYVSTNGPAADLAALRATAVPYGTGGSGDATFAKGTTAASLHELARGTTYTITVVARDAAGNERMYPPAVVTTEALELGPPSSPDPSYTVGSSSGFIWTMVAGGGKLHLVAVVGTRSVLFESDGTTAGTVMVPQDTVDSFASSINGAYYNGHLYFMVGLAGVEDIELHTFDGDPATIRQMADMDPSGWSTPRFLVGAGNDFFVYPLGSTGRELWASDGTAAGTRQVSTVQVCQNDAFTLGTKILFAGKASGSDCEPYLSDGTGGGTVRLKDIRVGTVGSYPSGFIAYNGLVYFRAMPSGFELWKTDGTAANTVLVGSLYASGGSTDPTGFAVLGNYLYAIAYDASHGKELWRFDTSGTKTRITDINAGAGDASITNATTVGTHIFFSAFDGSGTDLWTTDGTSTVKVLATHSGAVTNVGGKAFFFHADATHGTELWTSDGTPGGTAMVVDLAPGSASPDFGATAELGGKFYFIADGGLWTSDGTAAGTRRVFGVDQAEIEAVSTRAGLFFTADDGAHGVEPWLKSANGAAMIADLVPGSAGKCAHGFAPLAEGATFYGCDSVARDFEPWISDGTAAGTHKIKEINASTSSAYDWTSVAFKDRVYFTADDGVSGYELWRTDGTPLGTSMFQSTEAGSAGSSFLTAKTASTLYFVADGAAPGVNLWKSDGTTSTLVAADVPTEWDAGATSMTAGGERVYMSTYSDVFTTDGTGAGTQIVHNFPITSGSQPAPLVVARNDGKAFMTGGDTTYGFELWFSDGTPSGTGLVKDIVGGTGSSYPTDVTVAGDNAFFAATDGVNGTELWISDGTSGGTHLVKDIRPGPASSLPMYLRWIGGRLIFAADDGVHGTELWVSDGTSAGTTMVADLAPGVPSSFPRVVQVRDDAVDVVASIAGTPRMITIPIQ